MDAIWPYVVALGYPAIMLAVLSLATRARGSGDERTPTDDSQR